MNRPRRCVRATTPQPQTILTACPRYAPHAPATSDGAAASTSALHCLAVPRRRRAAVVLCTALQAIQDHTRTPLGAARVLALLPLATGCAPQTVRRLRKLRAAPRCALPD